MNRTVTRLFVLSAIAIAAQIATASINYNVLQATVAYNNGDTNTLDSTITGDKISFTNSSAMLVGNGGDSGHNAATVTIIYTATSDTAINGLNLDFSGVVKNLGAMTYSELVENWNANTGAGSVLASVAGNYNGAGGVNGSDDPFKNSTALNFSNSVFSYKVKKTFTLLDLDSTPANSSAQLNSVDQQPVPEPASMTALALGGFGFLARRKRK
jgi:hypothetical protein